MKNIKIDLFKKIYKIRKVEETISKLYSENEMRCPVHLSIGQEAVATGVCANLSRNDEIISTHRSHAHYIAKGGNLNSMIAEIYGKSTGCAKGIGGSMHLQDLKKGINGAVPIVGSTIPIGVGIAYYNKLKKNKKTVTIFFGEGATEEGVFHESLNFAGIHNLANLFICENNLYSVYTSIDKRHSKKRSLRKIAEANDILYFSEDGNDVNKVFNLIKKVLKIIKRKSKPVLVEFKTYRWLEHCGPNWDDELNYRPKGELKKWMTRCPLKKIKSLIKKEKALYLQSKIDQEVEKAFSHAKKSKFPDKKILNNFYF
tara:strand:- start:307 stop:1248 length:942 start_codon:yes stop_codon:yes gene_type:complete